MKKKFVNKIVIVNDDLPVINEKGKLLLGPQFINISENGCDFVKKLLNKNPLERLGSRTNAQNIKNHSFFADIDWIQLEKVELKPPLKPDVVIFI